ncbi:MAG: NUDIX domain-containing protein [Anaerolineae bacterium]|nr:NUDIX domain-containing protein [Anaerolineae bacterium]
MDNEPVVGRFLGGVGALIFNPDNDTYLLLKRAATKDFAAGAWECVTGRVDQGEGFDEALAREVREEIGAEVQPLYILGTTHFYRGTAVPENELIGLIYLCTIANPTTITISEEHDEYRWLTGSQALEMLVADDATTAWTRRVIEKAEAVRTQLTDDLFMLTKSQGFALD